MVVDNLVVTPGHKQIADFFPVEKRDDFSALTSVDDGILHVVVLSSLHRLELCHHLFQNLASLVASEDYAASLGYVAQKEEDAAMLCHHRRHLK